MTRCIPPLAEFTAPDDRRINLEDDLCICACPVPPRLIASSRNAVLTVEAGDVAKMPEAQEWLAYAKTKQYGARMQFVDSETGMPLANRKLTIHKMGATQTIQTDSDGYATIETSELAEVNVHGMFESPAGQIDYEA